MASHIMDTDKPEIFNQIIKARISDYINTEVKAMVQAKTSQIICDVLANLQLNSNIFANMLNHEMQLVVKAAYNGKDILQKTDDQ